MNLRDNVEITNFLKSTSAVYQDSGSEIIIHCPYCDDALRANSRSHGHLYISTKNPVFHCFRCETSGFLGTLLRDLGFTNLDILSEFGSPRFLLKKERSIIRKNSEIKKDIKSIIADKNYKYFCGDKNNYLKFEKYIHKRLGSFCDINNYLITPEVHNKQLCAAFYNYSGSFVTARIIEPINGIRYIRNRGISELYYFQDFDFDKYKSIVLTEGAFDAIKLFRFSDKFPMNETLFIGILGKNYGKVINQLLTNHIPIGSFNVNLIFDNDNTYQKRSVCFCRKIASRINKSVNITGYYPSILKDAGEFPFLEKVSC